MPLWEIEMERTEHVTLTIKASTKKKAIEKWEDGAWEEEDFHKEVSREIINGPRKCFEI